VLRLLVLFAAMAAFSKQLMKQNIFRALLGLAIAAVALLRAENLSRVVIRATPEILVQEALEKNPELNFYAAGIAAAKGGLKTAGTIQNPEFNSRAGYKNARDNSGGTSGDGAAWSLSVNQTFEYPGRVALKKAIAQGDIELAELHFEQFRLILAARVRTLACSIVIAQERSAATREIGDRFQALTDVLAQREPAGVTPVLEARIIDANALSLRRQEREAGVAVKTAVAELNQLRGRPVTAPLEISGGQPGFVQASFQTLLDTARKHAFDIRIREAELAQQGFKVSLSKNERYPAIAVGPYYSQENAADKEQQAGIGISVPLPFWDRNVGNIQTSKAREQQARASLLTTEREVESRVAQSATILQAKREEIEKWQADTIAKFRNSAELADRNYRLGGVPISIYVETQKQYVEVLGAVHEMKKDALQAAQELEILTGLKLYKSEQQP
jgi:cobalt-zinc-cadmium efflux system outer membrane protein